MEPIPESRARVLERIAHIEERYGRITAFRVVVKAPGAHHRTSGHYEVNIHMALPDGREIAVTRTATADERRLRNLSVRVQPPSSVSRLACGPSAPSSSE